MTDIDRFLAIGYGYGYGYGSGSGSGYGSGYGSGSGSGDGDGDGSGYGSGSGSGDGDVLLEYGGNRVRYIDGVPTVLQRVSHGFAVGYVVNADLTTSRCCVARCGNFLAHGGTMREAAKAAHDKAMEGMPPDKRVDEFLRAHPSRTRRYAGADLFRWHHILTGSCEFGRMKFCRDHGLDPRTARLTVGEFCDLTKDAYGGDIIRMVINKMEMKEK